MKSVPYNPMDEIHNQVGALFVGNPLDENHNQVGACTMVSNG
jgi:hypothetical protein